MQLRIIQCVIRDYLRSQKARFLIFLVAFPSCRRKNSINICRDGRLLTSSLVLAGLSSLLRTALDSVPRIDAYKMVIMPEEITISQVLLLNKIIFDESTTGSSSLLDLSPEQLNHVRTVSQVLGCEDILASPSSKNPMNSTSSGTPPPSRGIKRPAPIGNPARRRPAKTSRGTGAATTSLSSSSVKLEKTELNADYIDDSGLVRLSSVDEMAIHYCLLCDKKFKKYNQVWYLITTELKSPNLQFNPFRLSPTTTLHTTCRQPWLATSVTRRSATCTAASSTSTSSTASLTPTSSVTFAKKFSTHDSALAHT